MKSDYERMKFRKSFWKIGIIFLLLLTGWCVFAWGEFSWRLAGILLIVVLFLVLLYSLTSKMLDALYKDMESMSDIMSDIMEKGTEPPVEEYREGTVGILYSNFYKMVYALKDSRNREMEEKVFLRDIISDISHQLKTPLASLNVFMDLLLEDKVEDGEKRKQILREAQNQLSRMEWMVLSMLKLARIEAGAIQFDRAEAVLLPLLSEAAEAVQYLVKDRNQRITVTCPEDGSLICDRDWLVEALINLLKNASDYSGEGTDICIEVEHTNVYTRIYVKDEGTGIPEQEIPNIFKRFYRVNHSVNPNSVGIGLSLTKSIIEGMGGSIHVKSEVGEYTWFILTFVK
ncbi:MAG: HAMP domain-containing histidine kinase [Bacteroides sp.]|nr:HAMP domain-containing histidine kinase [Bacteroides sp.]MCM1549169.1 HAMP domain-containing histidine kinase [Clostridium sp.]